MSREQREIVVMTAKENPAGKRTKALGNAAVGGVIIAGVAAGTFLLVDSQVEKQIATASDVKGARTAWGAGLVAGGIGLSILGILSGKAIVREALLGAGAGIASAGGAQLWAAQAMK